MKREPINPTTTPQAPPDLGPRRFWRLLALTALTPLAATLLLYRFDVPLGCPGRFVYLYSPVMVQRLAAVPVAVLIALGLGCGIWLSASRAPNRGRVGLSLVALASAALAAWPYFAPPSHFNQHFFNIHSPSQDGAFVREAQQIRSVRDYLHAFPQRVSNSPEHMRGTRVISNPPAATLLAVGIERLLSYWPALGDLAVRPLDSQSPPADIRRTSAVGLVFLWALTGLWFFSGLLFYLIGRLYLPPAPAAAFSICCVFTPMTILLAPGKDPAQLLTVSLPLYFWLLAYRRAHVWAAVVAGALFLPACLTSLVHLWLGAIVAAATLLAARHSYAELRRVLLRVVLPTAATAVLGAIGLYFVWDLNLLAVIHAVARSQAEVTRGPGSMPLLWQLLGIPLFLLFAGPAWWTFTLWRTHPSAVLEEDAPSTRLGSYLLAGSALVMLATVGFTNLETPRLWIPFVPLLLLGAMMELNLPRQPGRRLALWLAVLVFVQVTTSALQWSLMDMRESETRLAGELFYG